MVNWKLIIANHIHASVAAQYKCLLNFVKRLIYIYELTHVIKGTEAGAAS